MRPVARGKQLPFVPRHQLTPNFEPLGAIVGRGLLGADRVIQLRLDGVGVLARIASPSRENGAPGMRRMLAVRR